VVICIIPDKRWATKINWMMCSVPHCRDVEEAEAAACLEGMPPQLVTISIWTHNRNIKDKLNFLHQMLRIACLPGAQM